MCGKTQVLCEALLLLFCAGALVGCQVMGGPQDAAATPLPLQWLEGCWVSEDRTVEENWTRSRQNDQLFGFSVTSSAGQRRFFEQMRIDIGNDTAVFSAYPRGQGPTAFEGAIESDARVVFVNSQNDFPQRIVYRRDAQRLLASVSLLDGSRSASWQYRQCD